MQNVRTVRHQQFEDIIYVRNTTQQEVRGTRLVVQSLCGLGLVGRGPL